ncbi:MAG: hypothetical protein ACW977_09495 [Candidatus Thorarchaeota archaeon]|jgi:DNA-binding transcriptional ArsR family regulator
MDDLLSISKALSNPTRIGILEWAALEHHLKPLVDAKLVAIQDVVIDKVKNSLLFPIASVGLDRSPEISGDAISDVIGTEIESDVNHDEIQEKAQAEVKAGRLDQEDAVAIVRTLFEHRGRGTKNMCSVCGRIRKMADLTLCERCFRPACTKCSQTIQREDGGSELLCDRCLNQLFS